MKFLCAARTGISQYFQYCWAFAHSINGRVLIEQRGIKGSQLHTGRSENGEAARADWGVLPAEGRVAEASDVDEQLAARLSGPWHRPRRLRHLCSRRGCLQPLPPPRSAPLMEDAPWLVSQGLPYFLSLFTIIYEHLSSLEIRVFTAKIEFLGPDSSLFSWCFQG